MSATNWKQYFDKKAETHGASVQTSDYFNEESFFRQRDNTLRWLGAVSGKTVLDAGCGVGAFSEPLVRGNVVTGVDFSEKSLAYAAKRGLRTSSADLTALPFADGHFDVVLCIGVIQLIPNYKPVLRELARVTKPRGTLLVQTLNRGSVQRKLLGLVEKTKKFDTMYAMKDMARDFAELGLTDIAFLNQYHPFKFTTSGRSAGIVPHLLSTSFAIKGCKR
ncbi:class I SAM-dependent methyltransferase [Paenibacillus cymbidii]|uniref:class I SAM-dependent methyltransferase n=1 Tax=Paenibacillus cymbidii TaxID=1639034 RepID=UPI0010822690|nr:class I SAM-dependent methyltransferase [Paenibacillus cymbidii]